MRAKILSSSPDSKPVSWYCYKVLYDGVTYYADVVVFIEQRGFERAVMVDCGDESRNPIRGRRRDEIRKVVEKSARQRRD